MISEKNHQVDSISRQELPISRKWMPDLSREWQSVVRSLVDAPAETSSMTIHHYLHPKHELVELMSRALMRHPSLLGVRAKCHWDENRLVLKGTVGTYYQKLMAQEAVREFSTEIDNQLEVIDRFHR